jgi:hypothetical protein
VDAERRAEIGEDLRKRKPESLPDQNDGSRLGTSPTRTFLLGVGKRKILNVIIGT